MSLHDACMICFWNLVGFITLRLQFPEARSASLFLFCKALPPPLEIPTFSLRLLKVFFVFTIFRVDETNASQSSSIIRPLASRLPILAFLSCKRLSPFWTELQATNSQVWWLLDFLLVSPWTTYIPLEVFFRQSELRESFPPD